jgi:hypothetical protein
VTVSFAYMFPLQNLAKVLRAKVSTCVNRVTASSHT